MMVELAELISLPVSGHHVLFFNLNHAFTHVQTTNHSSTMFAETLINNKNVMPAQP